MYKFVPSFFVALIAAWMVGSAFGSENRDAHNSGSCEAGRVEPTWLKAGQRTMFGSVAYARKNENVQSKPGTGLDRGTMGNDMGQSGKLALLENAPLPSKDRAKPVATRPDQTWIRLSDKPNVPEPGTWAILLAGFLGICAVARPRIFSS